MSKFKLEQSDEILITPNSLFTLGQRLNKDALNFIEIIKKKIFFYIRMLTLIFILVMKTIYL